MSSHTDIDDIVAKSGASREPDSSIISGLISCVAIIWSLFQIWVSSPFQFNVAASTGWDFILFNEMQIKYLHLSFGVFIVLLTFPAYEKSPKNFIPIQDWVIAGLSLFSILYLYFCYHDIALRLGRPSDLDIVASLIGLALLLEAARRSVGTAMVAIAVTFILFCHFGEFMPEILAHKNVSLSSISSYQWLSSEGVFGIALGVSSSFVFLYVLFGAFLEKTGAGNFFIHLSFSLLSKFTGGPAKAAVVASGLMGMISGSSIANTVTVGTFTVPLMRKMGLSAEKAGAIEVSAGINGQIMPPVMGAAAFIIAEYLSIAYTDVIKHAFLPAVLVYVALLYIVHLEALKIGLSKSDVTSSRTLFHSIIRGLLSTCLFFIFCALAYFAIQGFAMFPGLADLMYNSSIYTIVCILVVFYILVLYYQSKFPDLTEIHKSDDAGVLRTVDVLKTGLHFIIPIVILVWCLLITKLSPQLSGYWTVMFLIFTTVTQRPIKAFFRNNACVFKEFNKGCRELIDALISGAKNMTVVSVATATAGIIVGSVSVTGLGIGISSIIDEIANGSLIISLFITAIMCIILGMGMPTTACYVIVSTLMLPVLNYIMYKNAITIPGLALHLFVFYFGLMADVTPPVGLASYAAAAISGGDPIKTGFQAFLYNMRTMTLPFVFVFNPAILMYGVNDFLDVSSVIISSLIGVLAIAAGTQAYFIVRNKIYESIFLVIAGLSCLFPGVIIDYFYSPTQPVSVLDIEKTKVTNDTEIVLSIDGQDSFGQAENRLIRFRTSSEDTILNSLRSFGIDGYIQDDSFFIERSIIGSQASSKPHRISGQYTVNNIEIGRKQPSDFIVFASAFALISFIFFRQRQRN